MKCGLDPVEDSEKSKDIQESFGANIAEGVLVDARLREGLAIAVRAYNAGQTLEEELITSINKLRDSFAAQLAILRFQRRQAIVLLNDMEPALATEKLTAAGFQMAQLFVSPTDSALGGKRMPTTLFGSIDKRLTDLDPKEGFDDQLRSCGWLLHAVQRARIEHKTLSKLLPLQDEIARTLHTSKKSIECCISLSMTIRDIQSSAHESGTVTEQINSFIQYVASLAERVKSKLDLLPQAGLDAVSGVHRGGCDSYGPQTHVPVDPENPLSGILGDPEISNTTAVRRTYGKVLAKTIGGVVGYFGGWMAGLYAFPGTHPHNAA